MSGARRPAVGVGETWRRLLEEAGRSLRTLRRWAKRWRWRALQTVPWLASLVFEAHPHSEPPGYPANEAPSGARRTVAEELRWLDALEGQRARNELDGEVRGWAWANLRLGRRHRGEPAESHTKRFFQPLRPWAMMDSKLFFKETESMSQDQPVSAPLAIPEEWPQAEALFRAQMVAPLLDPLSTPEERTAWRRWVTERVHTLPNGQTRRIGERTLRRWVAQVRAAGYDGLQKQPRRDQGLLRRLKREWIDRAIELKREEPRRSVPHILRMLRTEFDDPIDVTPGALWRHLAKEGLGGRTALPKQGFRRWESAGVNQVWQADVKFGPHLADPLDPERLRRTYLIVFLDDYLRYVCHGEFFFADDVYALEVCFQKALLKAGKPARVYVDQGKNLSVQRVSDRVCIAGHPPCFRESLPARRERQSGEILPKHRRRTAFGVAAQPGT